MNKLSKLLNKQIQFGYWPGFTMAMYPGQFSYRVTDKIDFNVWNDSKEINLYFHIPFCKSKCPFCGFFSIANNDIEFMEKYMERLCEQLEFYIKFLPNKTIIKSVCFGGGTPNHIPVKLYEKLFSILENEKFIKDKELEISMEIAPELLTEDYLKKLHELGIKRLSLGVQSLDLDLRDNINRKNNYNLTDLFKVIKKYNFNVNFDVINGLPNQTKVNFMDTLEKIIHLGPESISIYPLAGKDSSMFGKNKNIMTNKDKYKLFTVYYNYLINNGYYCESNIKFVKCGQTSTHQQKICEYKGIETLGIGCGARSYNNHIHYSLEPEFNTKKKTELLYNYMNIPFKNQTWYAVVINEEELKIRYIIYNFLLGILKKNDYKKKFNKDILNEFPTEIEALLENNLIEEINNEYKMTEKGITYTDLVCSLFWSKNITNLKGEKDGNKRKN